VHVALTDNTLSQVLADGPTAAQASRSPAGRSRGTGSRAASGRSASTVQAAAAAGSFATEQRFLAETAMIVAEPPATPRSVVIAPPRQWNPTVSLATALLTETDDASWLRASVSSLISANSPAGQVPRARPPATKFGRGELHRSLLRKVKGLEDDIRLQASMFGVKRPSAYLAGAVAAVESSAWRGHPRQAKALLASVSAYLGAQERQVRIIDTGQDTLTGKSGSVPVSIGNRLGRSVTVLLRVRAPCGRMTVHPLVTITIGTSGGPWWSRCAPRGGSTVLRLSLAAPNGAPLPGTQAKLTVDATHFGTTALVIVAIALAVFVVTAIARAIRRGGGARGALLSPRRTPGPGQDANGTEPTGSSGETDTVVSEPAREHHTPEEPDEYASAPGRVDRP
jgi:hypothetical protein